MFPSLSAPDQETFKVPDKRSSLLSLQHSYREVGILLLYLAVGVSVFSGIAYTAEYEEVKLAWRSAGHAHNVRPQLI